MERFFFIGASSADAQPSAIKSRASCNVTSMISPVRRSERSIPSMRSASFRVSRIRVIPLTVDHRPSASTQQLRCPPRASHEVGGRLRWVSCRKCSLFSNEARPLGAKYQVLKTSATGTCVAPRRLPRDMMRTPQPLARWDRLQDVLLAIKPGDKITIDALVGDTGLQPQTLRTILDGLTRAELFRRLDNGAFLRCRLVTRSAPSSRDAAD